MSTTRTKTAKDGQAAQRITRVREYVNAEMEDTKAELVEAMEEFNSASSRKDYLDAKLGILESLKDLCS